MTALPSMPSCMSEKRYFWPCSWLQPHTGHGWPSCPKLSSVTALIFWASRAALSCFTASGCQCCVVVMSTTAVRYRHPPYCGLARSEPLEPSNAACLSVFVFVAMVGCAMALFVTIRVLWAAESLSISRIGRHVSPAVGFRHVDYTGPGILALFFGDPKWYDVLAWMLQGRTGLTLLLLIPSNTDSDACIRYPGSHGYKRI